MLRINFYFFAFSIYYSTFSASVIESTSSELENMRQENCHLQYKIQLKSQQVKDNATEKESIKEILREFICLIKDESSLNSESNPHQQVCFSKVLTFTCGNVL